MPIPHPSEGAAPSPNAHDVRGRAASSSPCSVLKHSAAARNEDDTASSRRLASSSRANPYASRQAFRMEAGQVFAHPARPHGIPSSIWRPPP